MNDAALIQAESNAAPLSPEWMPRRLLNVGVTGHRLERLGARNVAAVALAADRVLAAIAEAANDSAQASFRIVSGLAEGADSIVTDAALAHGWLLEAVLPFTREDYAGDFPEGSARAAHESRLALASAVFELPGDRGAPGGSSFAYERAGRVVLGQSDILIAIWDGEPAWGRGGAAQIVAEAVLLGIPVIHIETTGAQSPVLLWDGLEEHDFGQQTIDTVARADLGQLHKLVSALIDPPATHLDHAMLTRFERGLRQHSTFAVAYPLLLAAMGVRKLKAADFRVIGSRRLPTTDVHSKSTELFPAHALSARKVDLLKSRFDRADAVATFFAQLFRSAYVTNFSFAALAVVLALLGLALPAGVKPALIVLELSTIAVILVLTRAGNRAAWHFGWLDNRHLAERFRCLAISAQLGELDLRIDSGEQAGWVNWYACATARELGLPSVRVDAEYLDNVRTSLAALIDDQIDYHTNDISRMHRLEHRLHRLGTVLFASTALVCVAFLVFKVLDQMLASGFLDSLSQPLVIVATIATAAFPAVGAAIYGIRMQGDFAGNAQRSQALRDQLQALRKVIDEDDRGYDTLKRRVRHAADLLTEDLSTWLQNYRARPLVLPG